jgi:hypothetical protein
MPDLSHRISHAKIICRGKEREKERERVWQKEGCCCKAATST